MTTLAELEAQQANIGKQIAALKQAPKKKALEAFIAKTVGHVALNYQEDYVKDATQLFFGKAFGTTTPAAVVTTATIGTVTGKVNLTREASVKRDFAAVAAAHYGDTNLSMKDVAILTEVAITRVKAFAVAKGLKFKRMQKEPSLPASFTIQIEAFDRNNGYCGHDIERKKKFAELTVQYLADGGEGTFKSIMQQAYAYSTAGIYRFILDGQAQGVQA